jgi:hypothetical protein
MNGETSFTAHMQDCHHIQLGTNKLAFDGLVEGAAAAPY